MQRSEPERSDRAVPGAAPQSASNPPVDAPAATPNGAAADTAARPPEGGRVEPELSRALRVLMAANRALVRFEQEEAFLQEICRICVEEAEYRLAWIGYRVNDRPKSIRPVTQAGFEQGYLESCDFSWADSPAGRAPTGRAIRQGRPIVCQNVLADPHFADWRDDAVRRGYASTLALPLVLEAEVFGVLNIYSDEPEDFDEAEVRLLEQMAEDLAFGIGVLRTRRERAEAERELQRTAELLDRIFDNVHMLIACLDTDFNFVRVNQAYARAGKQEPDWFVGKNHFDLYPHTENEQIFREVLRTGEPYVVFEKPFTYTGRSERGLTYWDWSLRPVHDRDGQISGLVLTLVDVTERKRLEKLVLEASDREAERIGQDLHDTLGQRLAAMSYRCENLAHELAEADRPEASTAEELTDMARQTVREARALSHGLSPVKPGAEGLADALRNLAETTADVFDVPCEFDYPAPVPIRDGSTATHLFRIAQEAVNNAIRHARPSRITLRLTRDADAVSLAIADDGVGMSKASEGRTGMGLQTMRHRSNLVGGECRIEPGDDGGTVVRCRVPLPLGTPGGSAHG